MQHNQLEVKEIGIKKQNENTQQAQYSIPIGDNDDIYYSYLEFKNDNSSLYHSQNLNQYAKTNGKDASEDFENSKIEVLYDFSRDEDTQHSSQLNSQQNKSHQKIAVAQEKINLKNSQFKKGLCSSNQYSSNFIHSAKENTSRTIQEIQDVTKQIQQTSIQQMNQEENKDTNEEIQQEKEEEQENEEDNPAESKEEEEESGEKNIVINPITISKKTQILDQESEIKDASSHYKSSKKNTQSVLFKTQRTSNVNSISFQKGIFILQNQFKESQSRQKQIDFKVKKFIQLLKNIYPKRSPENLTQQQHQIISDQSDFAEQYTANKMKIMHFIIFWNNFQKFINEIRIIKVFKPNNKLIIVWDTFQVIFSFIFFYIFSVYLFFASHEEDIGMLSDMYDVFNFILIIDIITMLNTSFYLKDQIITKRSLIFQHYLKTSLIFDLISLSSSILVTLKNRKSQVYNPDYSAQQYFMNLLILARIKGISNKKGVFDSLQQLSNSQRHLIRLANQLLFMVSFAHTLGICWYLLGLYQEIQGLDTYWLVKYNITDNIWFSKYFYCLYWSVTTMTTVGYGDITPSNHLEALFNTVSMILFSCVFAYSINNIGMILQEIEKGTKELKDNIIVMQRYLRRRNVNTQLSSRIIHYLRFLASETKDRNKSTEDKIIHILSNKLRDELTLDVNMKMIQNCTILDKIFSKSTIKKLIFCMQEIQVSPNEIIFNQHDVGNQAIYFILDGQIEIYSELENRKSVYKILSSNQYFGEFSFFSGLSRKASARSLNLSTLYYLTRESFLQIIKSNQEDFQRYKMLEEQVCVMGDISALNSNGCFSCGQQDHYSINCKKTHFIADRQLVTLKYNYFEFQNRLQYQRQIRRSKQLTYALQIDFLRI